MLKWEECLEMNYVVSKMYQSLLGKEQTDGDGRFCWQLYSSIRSVSQRKHHLLVQILRNNFSKQ